MRTLVTGSRGYVGSVLIEHLQSLSDFSVHEIDLGFYSDPAVYRGKADFRLLSLADLDGLDAVIHLAAVSNDPMGASFEELTYDINHTATVKFAELCAAAGVKKFVFASSCSVYGFTQGSRPSIESSSLNPLTAYAKSKSRAEIGLEEVAEKSDMKIASLRFATAAGPSRNFRSDLVVNDLTRLAVNEGRISLTSDGLAHRPIIDVRDMAKALAEVASHSQWQPERRYEVINVGSSHNNWQVREIGEAVAALTGAIFEPSTAKTNSDRRSYVVNFDKFDKLYPDFEFIGLQKTILDVKNHITNISLSDEHWVRLESLRKRFS